MPRGKELEQLPMSNIAPGIGNDQSQMNRTSLKGMTPPNSGTNKKTNNK